QFFDHLLTILYVIVSACPHSERTPGFPRKQAPLINPRSNATNQHYSLSPSKVRSPLLFAGEGQGEGDLTAALPLPLLKKSRV
ncbi:MAG TPA: hypothetical protein PK344_12525, partial [Syntrophorhabdaceae bacterium]|nr:hypothetical protein [Syntrophorhabdaceae bacterium]